MKTLLAIFNYCGIIAIISLWVAILAGCVSQTSNQAEYDYERPSADITGDGCVNLADYYELLSQWQEGCDWGRIINAEGTKRITYQAWGIIESFIYTMYPIGSNCGSWIVDARTGKLWTDYAQVLSVEILPTEICKDD